MLNGRKVAVWPVLDAPGRKYAEDFAKLRSMPARRRSPSSPSQTTFAKPMAPKVGTLPTRRRPNGTSAGSGGCSTRPPTARTRSYLTSPPSSTRRRSWTA